MMTYLKISVHDTLFVHIVHSSQHLADQMGCILFSVRTLLHYAVEQLSSSYPAKAQQYLATFRYHYLYLMNFGTEKSSLRMDLNLSLNQVRPIGVCTREAYELFSSTYSRQILNYGLR